MMDNGAYDYLSGPPTGTPAPKPASASSESSLKKICLVCGDKALGYNFNAITCESCKAFFRRNALKQKVFKCPFREQCEITVLSRRFCQKCRLRKCLEVGMLTDLIMTTRGGERSADGDGCGLKIRKRRRHRDSTASTSNAYNCETGARSLYSTDMNTYHYGPLTTEFDQANVSPPIMPHHATSYPMTDKTETDQWHNPAHFYSREQFPLLPEYFDCDYEYNRPVFCSPEAVTFENKDDRFDYAYEDRKPNLLTRSECNYAEDRKPSLMAMSDINMENEMALQSCNGTRSNSSDSGNESNKWPACTLSDTMVTRTKINSHKFEGIDNDWAPVLMDFSSTLSAFKMFRLEELLSANEIMAVPNTGPPISFADASLAYNMGEVCLRRCFQLARRVEAFRNLMPPDQVTLLKGAATELMALRGIWVFQPHVDSWRPVGFPHRYLRLECTKTNNKLRKFYSLFPDEWRTNDPIMLCLSSIILFDPNQPNLLNRESVRAEQQFYYDLLKDYLRVVFSDTGEKYWRLCQLLTILRQKVLKLMPALRVDMNAQDLEINSVQYDWRIQSDSIVQNEESDGLTIRPLDN